MERESVHAVAHAVHERLCPVIVVVTGAGCDAEKMVVVLVTAVGVVAAVEVGVVFRSHVATASPALVSHAEIFQVPGLLASILASQVRHRRVAVAGHILHPFGEFLNGSGADITADIRFGAELLAEIHELVGTERVVLDRSAPVVVLHLRALAARSYAVHPVIFVGKAAAGPAQDGHAELLERVEYVGAVTVDVGDVGVGTYPQTTVDACAEVLGKLSVEFLVDLLLALVGMDRHLSLSHQTTGS